YPKVFKDFLKHRREYGKVDFLTTPVFFYGLKEGREIETDLEPGKTLVISLRGMSAPDGNGYRTIFYDLNGFPREIEILDQSVASLTNARRKCDPMQPGQVSATMPGKVLEVKVKSGDAVNVGQ